MRNRAWKKIWKHRKNSECPVPYFLVIYRTIFKSINGTAHLCNSYSLPFRTRCISVNHASRSHFPESVFSAWYRSSCKLLSPLVPCEHLSIHHNPCHDDRVLFNHNFYMQEYWYVLRGILSNCVLLARLYVPALKKKIIYWCAESVWGR